MTEHGFVEERVPVDADDWTGSMTLLYQATPDAVYDNAVQWVRLRLEDADPPAYGSPDTVNYEVDTVADDRFTRHTPAYTLTKEMDMDLPRHRGLPLDDILGYMDRYDGRQESWWTAGEMERDRSLDEYGRVTELSVAADRQVDGVQYTVDLSAERRHLPGWSVTGTLERGPEPLQECLAQVAAETDLDLPVVVDDHVDGTWNW